MLGKSVLLFVAAGVCCSTLAGAGETEKPATWQESWARQDPEAGPLRALIVTGHDHPAHAWRETSLALRDGLRREPRFRVDVTHDPELMATADLSAYDVVVLSYNNWERPGLSEDAREGLTGYLGGGGGLAIIHFASGAWHHSLPGAGDSDWPEYRKISRRVWHEGKSAHDPYQKLRVRITAPDHPVTQGIATFETRDELYYGLSGDLPIEVLAVAPWLVGYLRDVTGSYTSGFGLLVGLAALGAVAVALLPQGRVIEDEA